MVSVCQGRLKEMEVIIIVVGERASLDNAGRKKIQYRGRSKEKTDTT